MHPYTKALLSAVPVSDPDVKMKRILLTGEIPSPDKTRLPDVSFRTRCPHAMDICASACVQHDDEHEVACHLYSQE